MECKGRKQDKKGRAGLVLIETSWNVKVELQIERFFDSLVLIETSWNVKEKKRKKHHKGIIGINRNIVECKVQNAQDH